MLPALRLARRVPQIAVGRGLGKTQSQIGKFAKFQAPQAGLRLPFLPIHHVVALGEKLPGDWKYLTRDYVQNLSVMIGGVFGLFSITLWYYSIPFKEMEFMNSPWYETKLNNMRGDGSLAEFSRKKRAKFYLDGELENEVEYGTHY